MNNAEYVSFADMDRREHAAKLARIRATINDNRAAGRETYAGLSSDEIGTYNRAIMFGDNDEAFPSASEWSRIVD